MENESVFDDDVLQRALAANNYTKIGNAYLKREPVSRGRETELVEHKLTPNGDVLYCEAKFHDIGMSYRISVDIGENSTKVELSTDKPYTSDRNKRRQFVTMNGYVQKNDGMPKNIVGNINEIVRRISKFLSDLDPMPLKFPSMDFQLRYLSKFKVTESDSEKIDGKRVDYEWGYNFSYAEDGARLEWIFKATAMASIGSKWETIDIELLVSPIIEYNTFFAYVGISERDIKKSKVPFTSKELPKLEYKVRTPDFKDLINKVTDIFDDKLMPVLEVKARELGKIIASNNKQESLNNRLSNLIEDLR